MKYASMAAGFVLATLISAGARVEAAPIATAAVPNHAQTANPGTIEIVARPEE